MDQAHLIEAIDLVFAPSGRHDTPMGTDCLATVIVPGTGDVQASFAPVAKHHGAVVVACPPRRGNRTTYDKLGGATHAQYGAHTLRYLDKTAKTGSVGVGDIHARRAPRRQDSSQRAGAAGSRAVDDNVAEAIRRRYRHSLLAAFANLPPGKPPPCKHRGGWSIEQGEAWNLATRLRACEDQVLRLLADTRVRFDYNETERSLRITKLHDKVSGHFRSETNAKAFMTVRSYL